jgi:PAS domain S-box-containing protein
MFIWWGEHYTNLYNDAYRSMLGSNKHPHFLGKSAKDCWAEIWDVVGVMADSVITTGESTWSENFQLLIDRDGYIEETYFTFSYSPVRDESGGIGGVFCAVTETTQQIVTDRRLRILRELASGAAAAKTPEAACIVAVQTLSQNPADIPFALLYLTETGSKHAQLVAAAGLDVGTLASPLQVDLTQEDAPWSLTHVNRTGQAERVQQLETYFGELPGGVWNTPSSEALVMPIAQSGKADVCGFLVLAISPRRKFDDNYRGFFDLIASSVSTAISGAYTYAAERQRAEALAELDRAKTTFFSNVSHEFRTPLTLMLSPLEELLAADDKIPAAPRQQLELIHRNSLRLLKLVNTLLDFSRIEAGRMEAVYEPTDLAVVTAELASTFRSLIEQAGLSLVVECSPLPTEVYVDRELWEKIVLNLLSNAFKFTLTGGITVRLQDCQDHIELAIEDTGIGISPDEIPHLFERFYRVKGSQGRSYEGSGIGLSLVQELVKLHGGTIQVVSQPDQGTCITVSIPTGCNHLAPEHIKSSRTLTSTAMGAIPYLEEAWRWLPDYTTENNRTENNRTENNGLSHRSTLDSTTPPSAPSTQSFASMAHILVVDDNADMRDYVKRLLEQRYRVTTATDGIEALAAIDQCVPDLVLTDVMMPRLDGFGLLQTLRTHLDTRELPIILLSARAGEEARVEGLESGADDYLTKPFSSRELMARVEATLKMAQLRRESALREQALRLAAGQAHQETEVTFARLTQLLETMSDAVVELDRDWRITYQNAAAEQINGGKPRSQVLGKTHWEEWPASVGTEMEYQYRKAMAEQVPVCFEHHYYAPPTFDLWLEIHVYPSEAGLGIFFRDITHRKQSELAIREREEILQLFFKYVPSGIAMFDRQMHYMMASQRWVEDYKLGSVESVVGRSHYDVFPEISEQWKQVHQRALAGSTERCEADCFEREDGSIRWVRWEVRPWYQLNQDIGGIIIFAENITERKQAEVALQKSQLQLQRQLLEIEAIYQSAPIGLNVLDTNLRFIRINQHLADINGLSVDAHLGRTVREVLPEMADAAEPLLRSILETGEPRLNMEISGETPAQPGVQRTWLESFLPLKDGDRIVGISTVCEEITELKRNEAQRHQTEEALRRTKAELELRVAERTLELQEANDRLHQELLQREQIEQQLRRNKARYRAIVEDQTEMIARLSPDSKMQFVNSAFCRYFGIEPDELIGKSYSPVVYEADLEKVAQCFQSLSVENPVAVVENRVINGHGEIRWTQWVNRMLFDQQGNVIEFQAVGRDITQLKQVEQALRNSEERLQLAIEASGDGIWDWNIATDDVYYSPQFFQMLGYAPDELPQSSRTWYQLVHPDDMVWVQEILAAHLHDHSVRYEFDYRLRTKSGEWKWIADYGKVVAWDELGNPVRMIGTHRDINDRKLMEAALRQSEEQRRLALDLTRIGFWDFHLPTGELTWNDNHFALLGLPVGLARYEEWRDCIHPNDVKRVEQVFFNSIDTHTDYEVEYRVVYPDGSEHWLMARGQAIYDEQDQPLRSLGVVLDISDRKHMEASLQESDRRWRSLLDNVQLAVIGLDIDGNVEYANPFLLELVGYQAEEVIGQYWFDCFLNPSHNTSVKVAFREILEHNFHSHYQNSIVTKSGEERMIAWSNTVLRSTSGQAIGTISIGEDITERCKMERMKAEFISVVSHELRTPLTSMQAALSLLSEKIIDPASEEGEATIQIATEGTDRLVRLVNDILDLERLESGKIRLEKHRCDVADLVETAIAQMQELANQAEIRLEASLCGCQIDADSDRLLQVLTNLLSNAIKFSPNRSVVRLSVERQHSEKSRSYLLFAVCDEGRGIPADNLESIFDRFHQVDASDSREKGGTGLGLAICRSIIQQHGGAIWAESTAGQGSTFYFTVPLA